MAKGPVVVAGSTGHIGGFVVLELLARGYEVRALVRPYKHPEKVARLKDAGAQIVVCDPSDATTLGGVARGASAVVSCLGVRSFDGKDGTVWSVDRDATINVWEAAVAAGGVKVFVVVGSYEGRESRWLVPISEAKEEAIDRIRTQAPGAGISWAAVRPTAYFRDMVDYIYNPMKNGKNHSIIGDGKTRINPVDGRDVATYIADCVDHPESRSGDLQVGGPDILTFRELGDMAAREAGRDPKQAIRSRPVWLIWGVIIVLSLLGYVSRWAAERGDMFKFLLWASTHDAVGEVCGQRHMLDAFRDQAGTQKSATTFGGASKRAEKHVEARPD